MSVLYFPSFFYEGVNHGHTGHVRFLTSVELGGQPGGVEGGGATHQPAAPSGASAAAAVRASAGTVTGSSSSATPRSAMRKDSPGSS
jgi:hypothetical protein